METNSFWVTTLLDKHPIIFYLVVFLAVIFVVWLLSIISSEHRKGNGFKLFGIEIYPKKNDPPNQNVIPLPNPPENPPCKEPNGTICPNTNKNFDRTEIINKYKPNIYFPLEENTYNIASKHPCENPVFPYLISIGDTIEKPEYIPQYGYRFNGHNMLNINTNNTLPFGRDARSFIFAVNPKSEPTEKKPMFFFSYGQRFTHECGDGITNHDKSFGVFWGQPAPKIDDISEEYKGIGIRIFFYCEHCKIDRVSNNCDTKIILPQCQLNEWHIFAVTYDGNKLRFYSGETQIHEQDIILSTSKSTYLNIGGFVHHNENGAAIANDIDYSMNGFIREFMMFSKALSKNEIKEISAIINKLL